MRIIEPCCAVKHLMQLRDAIGKNGTARFECFGDMSLTELLPAILTRYSETELMIVAPQLPDQAAEVIGKWMTRQWARKDGAGKLDVVSRLTVIASLSRKKSPMASLWKRDCPFGDRLTLVDNGRVTDYVILLPDFAITGFRNLRYGEHFTATATTDAGQVRALWERFAATMPDAGTQEEEEESPAADQPAGDAPAGEAPAEAPAKAREEKPLDAPAGEGDADDKEPARADKPLRDRKKARA